MGWDEEEDGREQRLCQWMTSINLIVLFASSGGESNGMSIEARWGGYTERGCHYRFYHPARADSPLLQTDPFLSQFQLI